MTVYAVAADCTWISINILFLLGIVGFVMMGILGAKMDSASKRTNWIEQLVNLAAQICLLFGVLMSGMRAITTGLMRKSHSIWKAAAYSIH